MQLSYNGVDLDYKELTPMEMFLQLQKTQFINTKISINNTITYEVLNDCTI